MKLIQLPYQHFYHVTYANSDTYTLWWYMWYDWFSCGFYHPVSTCTLCTGSEWARQNIDVGSALNVRMCCNDYWSDNHIVTINDQKLSLGDLCIAWSDCLECAGAKWSCESQTLLLTHWKEIYHLVLDIRKENIWLLVFNTFSHAD